MQTFSNTGVSSGVICTLVLWIMLLSVQANAQCYFELGHPLQGQATMPSLIYHFVSLPQPNL